MRNEWIIEKNEFQYENKMVSTITEDEYENSLFRIVLLNDVSSEFLLRYKKRTVLTVLFVV